MSEKYHKKSFHHKIEVLTWTGMAIEDNLSFSEEIHVVQGSRAESYKKILSFSN